MSIGLFFIKKILSIPNLLLLVGPLLAGVSIFIVLSNFMIPIRITIPSSVCLSLVVFGMCMNYQYGPITRMRIVHTAGKPWNSTKSGLNLFFIIVYIIFLLVCTSSTNWDERSLFIPWKEFNAIDVTSVVAAISLSFFIPGYALIVIVDKENQLQPLPKFLVAFLLSMLITGLTTYILGSAGFASPHIKGSLISIAGLILILYTFENRRFITWESKMIFKFIDKLRVSVRYHISEIITFSGFLALVVLFTYCLYGGAIISDQWFHHSRALYFVSGSYRDIATQDLDWLYPPFFSAILGGFFSLSGVPSVNAYVSIHILNLMPILAFYYFFTKWSPARVKRASLIATGLFVLSSGFGWIYGIATTARNTALSPIDLAYHLQNAGLKTFDIHLPNTFVNVSSPDFTTGLIIIGLPSGFILLGLLKEKVSDKIRSAVIVFAVSSIGIFSHDEFYLFIIVASVIPPLFRFEGKSNIYAAILVSVTLTILADFISPAKYYTVRQISGIPLVLLSLSFIVTMWLIYISKISHKISVLKLRSITGRKFESINFKLPLGLFLISLAVYFYLSTFIVWNQFSVYEVAIHTSNNGQRDIPWYLYPMKFGITGALGITFILSYFFKKFEKEIFVFGIIAVVALLAGPYYDEHRFSKYIMVGMVGFASILVYEILLNIAQRKSKRSGFFGFKPLLCSLLIGSVFISASLSVFMFIGYRTLLLENPVHNPPGRLDFPSTSEMQLISFLGNDTKGSRIPNIATWAKESNLYYGFIGKLESFLGIPRSKILQSPLTLNASSLEGLYKLLEYSNTQNIVFPRYSLSGNGTLRHETVVPLNNENSNSNNQRDISEPLNFVFDSFPKAYLHDNYTVLNVPRLSAPSSENSQIGLVFDPDILSSVSRIINNSNTSAALPYNDDMHTGLEKNKKFVKISQDSTKNGNGNGNGTILTLYGEDGGRTYWSNTINERIQNDVNYIEAKLRFIEVNKTRNDFGIKFQDENGDYEYYVTIVNYMSALELRQRPISHDNIDNKDKRDNKELVLSQNQELTPKRNTWYTLKILILKDTINVYMDDILKLKITKFPYAKNLGSISKIGVRADNNIAQFGSLKLGYFSDSYINSYENSSLREKYYHHYYPLSALALSKLKYNTFTDGDLSVFAKETILLTSDPILETKGNKENKGKLEIPTQKYITEKEFDRYLAFVRNGGTLIVMDPDIDSHRSESERAAFSEFLSIRYLGESAFDGIGTSDLVHRVDAEQPNQVPMQKERNTEEGKTAQTEPLLNIPGVAKKIEIGNSSNTFARSFYFNYSNLGNSNDKYGQEVSPFAIEKKYGKGRIIFVNTQGYLDTVFHSPEKFFKSLGVIPKLVGLENYVNITEDFQNKEEIPITRFIGNFDASGQVLINTSSFSLFDPYLNPEHNLRGDILFSSNGDTRGEPTDLKFEDALIEDLRLIGPYEVSISSGGIFHMPSRPSEYSYVISAVLLPLDTLIKLHNGSSAEITIDSSKQYVRSNGGSEIRIRDLRSNDDGFVDIITKSPLITVTDGKSKFSRLYSDDPMAKQLGEEVGLDEVRPDFSGVEAEVIGNLSLRFNHVDHYSSGHMNGTTLMYLSYLNSLNLDEGSVLVYDTVPFKVPGDLSSLAKELGMEIPLKKLALSDVNILLLIIIPIAIIIIIKLDWGTGPIRRRRI